MDIRYEDVPKEVDEMLQEIQKQYFPELRNAKIKCLFDKKKRTHGGQLTLGKIMKPNELIRHLTREETGTWEGYDYIIVLDKVCWTNTIRSDWERLIRHELRHTYFDIESENDPYRLVDHDITDFHAEVELNQDDPRWRERLAIVTGDIYEQEKDQPKQRGKKNRGPYLAPNKKTPIEELASDDYTNSREQRVCVKCGCTKPCSCDYSYSRDDDDRKIYRA